MWDKELRAYSQFHLFLIHFRAGFWAAASALSLSCSSISDLHGNHWCSSAAPHCSFQGSILKSPWCQTGHAMSTGGTRPCLGESSSWLKPCSNHHIMEENKITQNMICLHRLQGRYLFIFHFPFLRVFVGYKQRTTRLTIWQKKD